VALAFAAGAMLLVSFVQILPLGIEWMAETQPLMAAQAIVYLAFFAGIALVLIIDRFLPSSMNPSEIEGREAALTDSDATHNLRLLRSGLLVAMVLGLHNFPEGMAVGVGFGTGDIGAGTALAIGIGIQNMPDGLAVMLPLLREGYSVGKALLIASLSGMVEAVGGAVGAGLAVISQPALPWALAFAAGAMLFVISDEIIPETHHNKEHARLATFALVLGFIIMMALDNLLG